MQLTARQREFAGIAGWAVPVSVTLGAVFGHFQTPNGGVWGYIQGAVAAILISTTSNLFNTEGIDRCFADEHRGRDQ
jgi:hypothetical protein